METTFWVHSKFVEYAESNSHNSAAEVSHLHIVPNTLDRKKNLISVTGSCLGYVWKGLCECHQHWTLCCLLTHLLPYQLLQLWIPWILSPGSAASLVETEETPENTEGMLMPQNQQVKEIFKWGTPPISCVAHI